MRKLIWAAAAVLLLAACGADKQKSYSTIDLKEVEQLQQDGGIVMDVREVDEFETGHIAGAVNMPLSKLQEGIRTDLDKDETYIVICRSGNRSKQASDILFDEGYDVSNVSEGMSTWKGDVVK